MLLVGQTQHDGSCEGAFIVFVSTDFYLDRIVGQCDVKLWRIDVSFNTWVGDHHVRLGNVTLGPFVFVEFNVNVIHSLFVSLYLMRLTLCWLSVLETGTIMKIRPDLHAY